MAGQDAAHVLDAQVALDHGREHRHGEEHAGGAAERPREVDPPAGGSELARAVRFTDESDLPGPGHDREAPGLRVRMLGEAQALVDAAEDDSADHFHGIGVFDPETGTWRRIAPAPLTFT